MDWTSEAESPLLRRTLRRLGHGQCTMATKNAAEVTSAIMISDLMQGCWHSGHESQRYSSLILALAAFCTRREESIAIASTEQLVNEG